MRRAVLVSCAALGALAGCDNGVTLVDPCSSVSGTCVALQIDPSASVTRADSFSFHVLGGGYDFVGSRDASGGVDLPVAIALTFPNPPASPTSVTVDVIGSLGGAFVGSGSNAATITDGQHTTVHVQLVGGVAPDLALSSDARLVDASLGDASRGDGGVVDGALADLTGRDAPAPDSAMPSDGGTLPDGTILPDGSVDATVVRDLMPPPPDLVVIDLMLPPPTITNVSPNRASNTGGQTVTITGTNFVTRPTVAFGSVNASNVTFVSSTQLLVVVPAQAGLVGAVTITVTNPDGQMATWPSFQYFMQLGAATPITIGGAANVPSLVSRDFNGDGNPDLALATGGPALIVLLGDGTGGFTQQTPLVSPGISLGVSAGDFNKDGKIDLVSADGSGASISVYLGNGDGTFGAAQTLVITGSVPTAVAVGDLNGDGNLDVAAALGSFNRVQFLVGNGAGGLSAGSSFAVSNARSVALGDYNIDGRLDAVATSQSTSSVVAILSGNGNGYATSNFAVAAGPTSVASALLNQGSTRPVVVTANQSAAAAQGVSALVGKPGNGTFSAAASYAAGNGPIAVTIADLDADGRLDVLTADSTGADVSLLYGNGDGTLATPPSLFPVGGSPASITTADFNKDGHVDVAVGDGATGLVSILLGG